MRYYRIVGCCIVIFLIAIGCQKTFELEYYDSGQLKSKTEIRNGIRDGEMFRYYESGSLMAKGTIRSGRQEGKVEWFYESGELEEVNFYVDNELDGLVTKYYKNGQIRSTLTYKHGKPIGQNIRYGVDGSLTEQSLYDSLSNLYYLTLWDAPGHRKMQAFMPIFSVNVKSDSIYISVKNKIEVSGTTRLSIGPWNLQDDEIFVLASLQLSGNTSQTISIPSHDVEALFYKIEFWPADSDSIKGFEFYEKIYKGQSPRDTIKSL